MRATVTPVGENGTDSLLKSLNISLIDRPERCKYSGCYLD